MPLCKPREPVIVGTRKNGQSTVIKHQPRHREILGRAYTLLSQLILNTWVTDFTCGFKAFSREAKDDIFSRSKIDRWGYDSEILFLAGRLGYNISNKPWLGPMIKTRKLSFPKPFSPHWSSSSRSDSTSSPADTNWAMPGNWLPDLVWPQINLYNIDIWNT